MLVSMKKIGIFLALVFVNISAHAFEVVAHRGVYQTYGREGLDNETCTATRIQNTGHTYLENTTASIRKAFELGATMVEFDIHPTTEGEGKEDQMVVFHDWTLDCRTEARCSDGCKCENNTCVTHLQPLAYLKSLDLGYGYTYDGGKTFPFRGHYKGQMPTLEEVLDLLLEFPDKKLTLNQKDKFKRTTDIFLRIVSKYPLDVRRRIYFEYYDFDQQKFKDLEIQEAIYQSAGPVKPCLKKYLLYGWTGVYPKECSNTKFFIPLHESLGRLSKALDSYKVVDVLWGWPKKFIERAHEHGTKVYISQVESREDLEKVLPLPIDGIMTDKIEVIGPLLTERK